MGLAGIKRDNILVPVLGGKHPLVVDGDCLQQQGLGAVQLDLEGRVVHHGDDGGLGLSIGGIHGLIPAIVVPGKGGVGLAGLRIHAGDQHVIVIVDAVLRGEGLAVRPFHAVAEIDGVGQAVIADIIALCHVGLHAAVLGQAEQGFLAEGAVVPQAAVVAAQGTAVLRVFRGALGLYIDVLFRGQALAQLREFSRCHELLQHGRFLLDLSVALRRSAGVSGVALAAGNQAA